MIFDKLNNAKPYYKLDENLKKGFEFLLNNDLKSLNEGKYEILGDKIFANIQSLLTKDKSDKKWEAHRKYIDIQYVITGNECMGYGIYENFKNTEKYNEDKDVEFLEGKQYNYINVKEGEFVIFYPNDVHAPMLSVQKSENIKKAIVKIAIN